MYDLDLYLADLSIHALEALLDDSMDLQALSQRFQTPLEEVRELVGEYIAGYYQAREDMG